jgi:Mg-chelatase subunit ChlD
MLRNFIKLQESLTGNLIGASLKTFTNTKVRQGQQVKNPKKHALDYAAHVQKHFDKMIDKVKTPAAKDKYKKQQQEYVREFRKHANNLGNIVLFQNLMIDAKMQIVRKLNSVKGLTDTFIRTANGYKVTNPEGYVAIDRVQGNAVKLVDRMEFSYNNFTALKAWDK